MKKLILIVMLLGLLVAPARAEIATNLLNIDTIDSNYIRLGNTWTNATEWGMTTGTVYLVYAVGDIDDLSEAASATNTTGSDFRALVYAMNKHWYDKLQALDSTNRPENMTMTLSAQNDADADFLHIIRVDTKLDISTITINDD